MNINVKLVFTIFIIHTEDIAAAHEYIKLRESARPSGLSLAPQNVLLLLSLIRYVALGIIFVLYAVSRTDAVKVLYNHWQDRSQLGDKQLRIKYILDRMSTLRFELLVWILIQL